MFITVQGQRKQSIRVNEIFALQDFEIIITMSIRIQNITSRARMYLDRDS